MKSYIARNAVINIFLIIIGISFTSASKLDGVEEERNLKVIKAKPAICQPDPQVVPIFIKDPSVTKVHFPNCIRINRCGGCCNHELMSCQPRHTETRHYEIRVFMLDLYETLVNTTKEIVSLEEHIQCECQCSRKAKDCTDKQVYLESQCRCMCRNSDERDKCVEQNQLKYWDESSCSCHCREIEECSSNTVFDKESCSCVRR